MMKVFMLPSADVPPEHLFPMSLEADNVTIGRGSLVFGLEQGGMPLFVDRRHVATIIISFEDMPRPDDADEP